MKKLLVFTFLIILLGTVAHAQKKTFLRIYSLAGNKFSKGYFAGTTDSSLFIYKNDSTRVIAAVSIGYIKTGRSLGHNVLISAIAGAITGGIIGAVTTKPPEDNDLFAFTPGEAAVAGMFVGSVAGTATGALISALTKSTTFTVNGRLDDWRLQRKRLDLLPVYKKRFTGEGL